MDDTYDVYVDVYVYVDVVHVDVDINIDRPYIPSVHVQRINILAKMPSFVWAVQYMMRHVTRFATVEWLNTAAFRMRTIGFRYLHMDPATLR